MAEKVWCLETLKRIIDGFQQIIQDKAYQNIFIILKIKDLKTENIIDSPGQSVIQYVFNSVCLFGIYTILNDSKTAFEATKKTEQIRKDYSEN